MAGGHVFVVQGRLESVDADLVVIPTDERFNVGEKWAALWSDSPNALPTKPDDWKRGSASPLPTAPTPGTPQLCFIDAARSGGEDVGQTIDKIIDSVGKIIGSARVLAPGGHGRVKPLVAIPTLGVQGGGLGGVRGDLIAKLLRTCHAATKEHDVDVVIVAFGASDHAAFQYQRTADIGTDFTPELLAKATVIGTMARSGELALFVGAGVSMSAGLPSWRELLEQLQEELGIASEDLDGLNELDKAELFSRESEKFASQIVTAIGNPSRAGLSHLLLANLGCREVVTTNFDLLYEIGAQTGPGHPVAVLPQHSPAAGQAWLLKMHGDINDEKSIVLSRRDFVGYDSANGPAGAMFQALLLSRHLLVVGASLTDDNFLRLAYEVEGFLKVRNAEPRVLGTVVTHEPQLARKRLFKDIFEYIDASGGTGGAAGARALAIFLDLIAHQASDKSSFLLDPTYRDLLPAADRRLADDLQPLIAQIAAKGSTGGPWRELDEKLRSLGAQPNQASALQ